MSPQSGAGWAKKGDVRVPSNGQLFGSALIEFKWTGRKQITIQSSVLEKINDEAVAEGRRPVLGISLNGLNYVVLPEDSYLELVEEAVPTRTCSVCREDKVLDEVNFSPLTKNGRQGFHYACRPCERVRAKAWQVANRERVRESSRASQAAIRKYVSDLKRVPCTDCGGGFAPHVMDFDHLEGESKVKSISELVANRASRERIDEEIAKCEVVCANCHRERTHQRRLESILRGDDYLHLCAD